MSKFVAGLAVLLLTSVAPAALAQSAPTTAAATPAPDPALAALLTDYEAFLKANDPISAGFEGDQAAKSKLPDLSRAAELARKAPLEAFLARAEAIPTAGLSSDDRLNRDFLAWVLKRSIEAIQFDDRRLAFDSEGGVGQTAAYVASGTRITTRADADAWIAGWRASPSSMMTAWPTPVADWKPGSPSRNRSSKACSSPWATRSTIRPRPSR